MNQSSTNLCYPDIGALWKKLSGEFRLAFLSAFIIGCIVHLYVFSNLILNHDGVYCIRTANSHLSSGRWALSFFSSFSWIYETPVVIALLSILALALSAAVTVLVLELSDPVGIVLTSGFMVSFPTVACTFAYLFTADAYFIAALLSAAGVWFARRLRFGWVAAVLCIGTACGIYQAYVGLAAGLLLFDCILALLSERPVKAVVKQGISYILILLAALVFYRLALSLFLFLNHASLSNYMGMSDALGSGVGDYLKTLPTVYRNIFEYFWRTDYLTRRFRWLQRLLFAGAAGCFLYLLRKKRVYKEPVRLALVFAGVLLLPPAIGLIDVVSAGKTWSNELMRYSYVLVYVFIVKILEMGIRCLASSQRKHWKLPALAGLFLCGALVWNNFCIDNAAYLRMQLQMENSIALANRITARIEEMDEYTPETPIAIVGSPAGAYGETVSFSQLDSLRGTRNVLMYYYSGPRLMRYFIGLHLKSPSGGQKNEILASGVLDSMPCYPARGSIQYYNGVIIVKLSDSGKIG